MFHPSLVHHQSCRGTDCRLHLPDTFGLLCWNIHKNNRLPDFSRYLASLHTEHTISLMLFQEAEFRDESAYGLGDFAFDAAANLELAGTFYGVLTASPIESKEAKAYLSEAKESLIGTHKSLLFSRYQFIDGTPLLILNLHAINFREAGSYERELRTFIERTEAYEGAMIVAGDFNSWSRGRARRLHAFRERLGLDTVLFEEKRKIKAFMGKHLDFIFYRGVELIDSAVFDDHELSDHNPLYAKFRIIS